MHVRGVHIYIYMHIYTSHPGGSYGVTPPIPGFEGGPKGAGSGLVTRTLESILWRMLGILYGLECVHWPNKLRLEVETDYSPACLESYTMRPLQGRDN